MLLFRRTNSSTSTDIEVGRSDAGSSPSSTAGVDATTIAHLQVLGLRPGATWDDVTEAHRRLVSDLTPGPDASHRNVALAESLLKEVNQAFDSLRILSVA